MAPAQVPKPALAGRSIIVTRAKAQAQGLTTLLEALGGFVIHCPTIEFIPPSDSGPLDNAIDRIESFDWIVFTSANAVSFFCRRLLERHPEGVSSLLSLVACAIGPATAKALAAVEVEVDLVAEDSTSEGVVAAIIEFAGGGEALSGVRVLVPQARLAREVIPVELSRLGALVETVEAYQTVRPDVDSEKVVSALRARSVDAILFTSPSTVSNFASIVGVGDLSVLLSDCLVACIGPVTAAAARELGLRNVVAPATHTSAALVELVSDSLASRRS